MAEHGMTGPLLTARQVADLLGVTTSTVLRWTRAGELPAVRLPSGQIRYREDELEAWLAARATGATSPKSGQPPKSEPKSPVTIGQNCYTIGTFDPSATPTQSVT